VNKVVAFMAGNVFTKLSQLAVSDSSGSAVKGVGLRPLACWDCGFDSRRQHASLSVVSVMFCQVEVSESGCGENECDREASTGKRSTATRETFVLKGNYWTCL
jgi:hypothetical protein